MVTTTFLLGCVIAVAQSAAADGPEMQLQPHPVRGQELYYRGTWTEEDSSNSVQFVRSYRFENRILFLEVAPQGSTIACLTVWKSRNGRLEAPDQETNSARLELGRLDRHGKVSGTGELSWVVPIDGPPLVESGAFVEFPRQPLRINDRWETIDPGQPPRRWRVAGIEPVNGTRCVRLIGIQQSDDWDEPRADQQAWRRHDSVWIAPQTGWAARVERLIERRQPARSEPSQRLVLKYELESSLHYPGQLFEDRRREIYQIHSLAESLAPLLPRASQVGPRPFEVVLTRIKNWTEQQPPTPYREAIRHVQRLAEAGRRGENPPTVSGEKTGDFQVATLGRPAPDFLTRNLAGGESARLQRWLGKPILLVFYQPGSSLGDEVLRFAQQLQSIHPDQLTVLGLPLTDDAEHALKHRDRLKATFPLLSGTGLRFSYAVDATPKIILIDAAGMVRGMYTGWGPETPISIREELARWLAAGDGASSR